MPINCAAIPENMLEALLFGHEKGAFTGAHEARAGKFEQAQGGTLLLDEVSEMHASLQAKLLRVLQEREVERIGARSTIPAQRPGAGHHQPGPARTRAAGRFREDLYYRLSVFPIALPPLRQRPADIVPLARHFIAKPAASGRAGAANSRDAAVSALMAYTWPGNVRELANLMQRAVILSAGRAIEPAGPALRAGPGNYGDSCLISSADQLIRRAEATVARRFAARLQDNLQTVEGRLILDALKRGGGSRKRAAELLGISPRTLRYKLARLRHAGRCRARPRVCDIAQAIAL